MKKEVFRQIIKEESKDKQCESVMVDGLPVPTILLVYRITEDIYTEIEKANFFSELSIFITFICMAICLLS